MKKGHMIHSSMISFPLPETLRTLQRVPHKNGVTHEIIISTLTLSSITSSLTLFLRAIIYLTIHLQHTSCMRTHACIYAYICMYRWMDLPFRFYLTLVLYFCNAEFIHHPRRSLFA